RSMIPGLPPPGEAPRVDRSANASPRPGAPLGGAVDAPPGSKLYRVQPQGETMREIARATLSTSERWAEVYKLNPSFRPQYPVPAGTVLRLPADARVDQGSVPR